jgi:aminopeptidase N
MQFRPFAAAAALAALLLVPAASAQTSQRHWLTSGPTPIRYEISVVANPDAETFTGQATIAIESTGVFETVTLNALDLTVTRATIDNSVARTTTDPEAQTLTLTPRRRLGPGRHTIRIFYSGKVYEDAYGLFRVTYRGDDGQQRHALATQFEPGDARRLAPMWDQPNRRAVFSVTVTAPSAMMAVSNMPAARTSRAAGGMTRTTFADTPSMASYLLFLAVGDFERVTRDVDGVRLGVVMRRGQGHRAQEALTAGEQSLRYYTEYFGIRYPLPKLDMVAIPGAGGFGAMENWGAILYFDQYLLVDENSSAEERQNVFGIVAHEIAHQWFGDLVTMAWWDDLWLNEGFASWMAAKATERWHPDWRPWMAQMIDGTSTAMALDAREGTHPIVQTVNTIDEANLAFDTITYEKGLAVIRMLEAYVGEEDFRRGVRDYLNAHLYGNAQTEDLWRAVQAASGQPVLDIAHNFTGQPGFPMLSVSNAACTAHNQDSSIVVRQQRFAMDDVSRSAERWNVPVVARRLDGGGPVRAVLPAQAESRINAPPGCGPYLVNAGQSGFFRVAYDERNREALTSSFAGLEPTDQLGLLLDYWAFARSGDAAFTSYLEFVSRTPAAADPVIVMDTAARIESLSDYAEGRPSEAAVKAWGRSVLQPYLQRAGWTPRDDENSNVSKMRATLIETLGALGDEAVIGEARRRVQAAETDPSALSGSVRNAAISVYAHNATPADYEALLTRARAAADFVDQRRLWLRIASAADPALARRSLELTLGDAIPRSIRVQVIAGVAAEHPRMGWDFLVAHRAQIETMLDPLQRLEYPANIAALNSDPAVAGELETYARDFPEGAQRTVRAAVAQIRLRAQTIRERFPAAETWIAQQNSPGRGRSQRSR